MKKGFSIRNVISEPDELFGREVILNQLIALANNGNSVAVIGHRRFGKTSVLRTVETVLRRNPASQVYPLFVDFKEVGSVVKGTDNVYRYLISRFTSQLFRDGYLADEIEFKKVVIKPSLDWEDTFDCLVFVNSVRIQGVFEEMVVFFTGLIGKGLLLLIDEYEWLFRFSFDEPVGFMKLRNFSSRQFNGMNTFSFWIAGCMSWEHLCSLTGSPELNVIDAPVISIGRIDYEAFAKMWKYEVDRQDLTHKNIEGLCESVYDYSGGIPFYAKILGNHLVTSDKEMSYLLLKPHFQELFDSFEVEEKSILIALATLPQNCKISKYLLGLVEREVVVQRGKVYHVNGKYFSEFIRAISVNTLKENGDEQLSTFKLTERIEALILTINNTNHNKRGDYIFQPVVDDSILFRDLRVPCYSLEMFSSFASSIYKILFERTKKRVGGSDLVLKRLPDQFQRGNEFVDIIDILRHSLGGGHLMGTFSQRHGQMSKAKMLELLTGSRNDPNLPEEYFNLQVTILGRFEEELNKLNEVVRSTI